MLQKQIGQSIKVKLISFTEALHASLFRLLESGVEAKTTRDMLPAFIDAVLTLMPETFVVENVPGLLDPKFEKYVNDVVLAPLTPHYYIAKFKAVASDFGVPQIRKRVIFVGFRSLEVANRYKIPEPTHFSKDSLFYSGRHTMGTRAALGLENIGFDCFAPTLRSGFTGPRKSTSILNSKASQKVWEKTPDMAQWRAKVQRGSPDVSSGEWSFQAFCSGLCVASGISRRLGLSRRGLPDTWANW